MFLVCATCQKSLWLTDTVIAVPIIENEMVEGHVFYHPSCRRGGSPPEERTEKTMLISWWSLWYALMGAVVDLWDRLRGKR